MENYYAIYFFDGNVITINRSELEQVQNQIARGAEWIRVQGNMINTKNIARVGQHESTAYMQTLDRATVENNLLASGKGHLIKDRKQLEKSIAIKSVIQNRESDMQKYEADTQKIKSINVALKKDQFERLDSGQK